MAGILRFTFLLLLSSLPTYVGQDPSVDTPVDTAAAAVAPPLTGAVEAADKAAAALVEKEAKIEFTKADGDVSGQITESEFLGWYAEYKKANANPLIDFHNAADPTGKSIPGAFRASVRMTEVGTLKFWDGFGNSLAMILVTELGDKTFFIAAILSMRHGPFLIFCGSITALAIMTVLGVAVGFVLPTVLPHEYTHWAAALLFVYFGVKLLKEGCEMLAKGEGTGPSDEMEEVENELKEKNEDGDSCESGIKRKDSKPDMKTKGAQSIYWQALTLTFIAEWGDRSQIATIALASAKDPIGVTIGGILGHCFCTGLACIGGKVIAGRISERTVLIIGGLLFLAFAIHAAIAGPG